MNPFFLPLLVFAFFSNATAGACDQVGRLIQDHLEKTGRSVRRVGGLESRDSHCMQVRILYMGTCQPMDFVCCF